MDKIEVKYGILKYLIAHISPVFKDFVIKTFPKLPFPNNRFILILVSSISKYSISKGKIFETVKRFGYCFTS